ncbi:hypothetical protein [Moorena sp. SIO3H5]|nr:hypothetical protein [Moorena sp. SIO3H5]
MAKQSAVSGQPSVVSGQRSVVSREPKAHAARTAYFIQKHRLRIS